MNNEIIIQITSGRGPAECCWVVSQVLKTILEEAASRKISAEVIQRNIASEPGTLVSALVKFEETGANEFATSWLGTVLWIGQSHYRKFHKRKNWFIGINRIDQNKLPSWNEDDIIFQTLRSSGPGGQHVNKTETAVRAIHVPSGTQVTASDSRSQLQNKKLAIERLQNKIAQWQTNELLKKEQTQWHQHNILERGNPVRVFRGKEFVATAFQTFCLLFLLI
jgi:peptide chain release factor